MNQPAAGAEPNARGVIWDLTRLFPTDAAAISAAEAARDAAVRLRERFSSHDLAALEADQLAALRGDLDRIYDDNEAAAGYGRLRVAVGTADAAAQQTRQRLAAICRETGAILTEFDNVLANGATAVADAEASSEVTGLQDRYQDLLAGARGVLPDSDTPASLGALLALGRSPDQDVRREGRTAAESAVAPVLPELASAYDALVTDRWRATRAGGDDHPIQAANRANGLSDEAAATLLASAMNHYEVGRRWYRLKARLLGMDVLTPADLTARVGGGMTVRFADAHEIITSALRDWPAAATITARLISERRVDAEPRPGKELGNFCTFVSPSRGPMVLLNYRDTEADLLSMVHEYGHAVHDVMASGVSGRTARPAPIMAEMAALFMERLVARELLASADPAAALAIQAAQIQGDVAAIFYQALITAFEHRVHETRRTDDSPPLSAETLAQFWLAESARCHGDSLDLSASPGCDWAWIPYLPKGPFRAYKYIASQALAAALDEHRARRGPAEFFPGYEHLLSAGGSATPAELLEPVGITLDDPAWFDAAMTRLDAEISAVEAQAGPAA